MITYRLADSLPRAVAVRLADECGPDAESRYRRRIEAYLDAGCGSCILREPHYAELIVRAWAHDEGEIYDIHAWVVMPNHDHILISLKGTRPLSRIIQSWNSFTGRRLPVSWQREYWDRFVRDERHFQKAVAYIHQNPVAAGLCAEAQQWPWSSAANANWPSGNRTRDA